MKHSRWSTKRLLENVLTNIFIIQKTNVPWLFLLYSTICSEKVTPIACFYHPKPQNTHHSYSSAEIRWYHCVFSEYAALSPIGLSDDWRHGISSYSFIHLAFPLLLSHLGALNRLIDGFFQLISTVWKKTHQQCISIKFCLQRERKERDRLYFSLKAN